LFTRGIELFEDNIYTEVKRGKDFWETKSIYKDAWYNFIIPLISAQSFSWKEANAIITKARGRGRDVSLSIEKSILPGYLKELEAQNYKKFGSDVYMHQTLENTFEGTVGELVEVDESNLDEYICMTKECFPEWDNIEEYSRYFYQLTSATDKKFIYKTYLLKVDDSYVSFGSLMLAPKLNLAYLHNAGTVKKHRHKGYYSSMAKLRCNVALQSGLGEIFLLVEEDGGSFQASRGLGFKPKITSYIFTKI